MYQASRRAWCLALGWFLSQSQPAMNSWGCSPVTLAGHITDTRRILGADRDEEGSLKSLPPLDSEPRL
jgi:hypothetical protein